jgi:sigma-B regulation protein RsbU (phosphoserine phosphatase)
MMARTHSMFRSLAGRPDAVELFSEPAKAISLVNDALSVGNDSCMFVTFLLASLNVRTRQLTYVRAGHVPPFRRDGSDTVARLTTPGGPPLGVAPGFAYRQDVVTLAPDDRLLIVTDGFTEANDPAGELFGEARIETFLAQAGSGQPTTLRRLVEKVREFEAGRPAFDDMAAILLSMSGPTT